MNFELTQERHMLQDTLRRYLANASGDVWPKLAELGAIGALFTKDQGGYGGTGFDLAVVFEELGRVDLVLPLIDNALVPGRLLAAAGGDVSCLIAGTEKLAFAHTELATRYDLNWVETTVVGNLLNGIKSVVMGADDADALLVAARHSGRIDDSEGIGVWRVEKDAKGLTLRSYETVQGGKAADITLDDTLAKLLMLDAFEAISHANAAGTLAQAAQTLGAMETVIEMTRDHLGTRKQFGCAIGTFQALAHIRGQLRVHQTNCS